MITVAVITLSDKGSRGEREDLSGPAIKNAVSRIGATVSEYAVLPDEKDLLREKLIWCSSRADVIITTGGTGLSPRDITPEATREVLDYEIPGIPEAMRAAGLKKTERAMLSRGVAGVRGKSLIINLPGSVKAVTEGLDAILSVIPHAVEKIKGSTEDCGSERGHS